MAVAKRRGLSGKVVVIMALLVAAAVLAYAWIDGGREPLREIAVQVPVPAAVPEGAR